MTRDIVLLSCRECPFREVEMEDCIHPDAQGAFGLSYTALPNECPLRRSEITIRAGTASDVLLRATVRERLIGAEVC